MKDNARTRYADQIERQTANLERLATEVRAARNSLLNAIICRRQHPTYGYTKTMIKEGWQTFQALAAAYAWAAGISDTVSIAFAAVAGCEAVGIIYQETYNTYVEAIGRK